MRMLLLVYMAMMCYVAQAGESATTVRATEMKAKPFTDAETVANLEQGSKVEVLARKASWMQVKADDSSGWVKMLSLRFSNVDKDKSGDSGLGSLFNVASKGGSGGTVTTGVRGLSEENLKNAKANPEALEVMQGYAADKAGAQKFAKSGSLREQDMDYVSEAGNGGKK